MVKKNAFTIVELIVAMGLLVLLVGLSSVVFSTTVKAHRKATATIEITRNLRVLAEQLNADFQGLDKTAPLFIGFNLMDTNADTIADTSYDTIHLFANGDFQTVRQYDYDSDGGGIDGQKTITGNLGRIYYGHANSVDIFKDISLTPDFQKYHVLSRKSHILTADASIFDVPYYGEIPEITGTPMYDPFDDSFGTDVYPPVSANILKENGWEFNTITLSDWINALNYLDGGTTPANAMHFIAECMADDSRPYINMADYQTLHLLMTQGTLEFSIQWAYTPDDLNGTISGFSAGIRWWPSTDPDGNGNPGDSDFGLLNGMNREKFGVFFGLPFAAMNADGIDWVPIQGCRTNGVYFKDTFYPTALKFTFVLKDANMIFPEGKTFSHIVSLDK